MKSDNIHVAHFRLNPHRLRLPPDAAWSTRSGFGNIVTPAAAACCIVATIRYVFPRMNCQSSRVQKIKIFRSSASLQQLEAKETTKSSFKARPESTVEVLKRLDLSNELWLRKLPLSDHNHKKKLANHKLSTCWVLQYFTNLVGSGKKTHTKLVSIQFQRTGCCEDCSCGVAKTNSENQNPNKISETKLSETESLISNRKSLRLKNHKNNKKKKLKSWKTSSTTSLESRAKNNENPRWGKKNSELKYTSDFSWTKPRENRRDKSSTSSRSSWLGSQHPRSPRRTPEKGPPPGPDRRPNGAGGAVPEPRTPVTGGGRTSTFRTRLPSLVRLET